MKLAIKSLEATKNKIPIFIVLKKSILKKRWISNHPSLENLTMQQRHTTLNHMLYRSSYV